MELFPLAVVPRPCGEQLRWRSASLLWSVSISYKALLKAFAHGTVLIGSCAQALWRAAPVAVNITVCCVVSVD